ncbi:zinc-dependent alcohol dehydrogenase family protein [Nocardia alba]|uniref:D-arabinose 1-dehydrogenase-like Zn-dependent alcohol dehydrogenase n=1 Tax=Nocardia alba TaxID=225051 RepID=A0A4R1FEZ4_9NOCA|nr:NAD(P)-dependent alcohol dehydrogenase [Nocardia alba]TCJ89461.1 D-arabinose 1-dehydrogenase-like Zn-dependent alcohol dehydrogenase [Nocardia alba]
MSDNELHSDHAYAYHLDGGLTRSAQQRPEPGPHQVLIRVRAASVNRRDLMLMDGTYPLPATAGVIPLSDGVGEVIALGPGVTRAGIGDRITASYFVRWVDGPQTLATAAEQYGANYDGFLATYALIEEDSIVHVPAHLTDTEAATLSCAGMVAWSALTTPAPPASGARVVTVGSGAVALYAIQFAKILGAEVISITSSQAKAQRLRALGADTVIDRTVTGNWGDAVMDLTGTGAEHVIDTVGLPTLEQSVRAGAYNSTVTMVGAMAPAPGTSLPDNPFGSSYLSIRRIAVGSRAGFEAMNRVIAEHRLRPVIDREFDADKAADAYDYLRSGASFGKVVIAVG